MKKVFTDERRYKLFEWLNWGNVFFVQKKNTFAKRNKMQKLIFLFKKRKEKKFSSSLSDWRQNWLSLLFGIWSVTNWLLLLPKKQDIFNFNVYWRSKININLNEVKKRPSKRFLYFDSMSFSFRSLNRKKLLIKKIKTFNFEQYS